MSSSNEAILTVVNKQNTTQEQHTNYIVESLKLAYENAVAEGKTTVNVQITHDAQMTPISITQVKAMIEALA